MKKILTVICISATTLVAFSQNKSIVELTLSLRDGNVITGTSSVNAVELKTDYGKLDIPIKNISSIEVGIMSDETLKEKANKFLPQLQSTNEEMRRGAYAELLNMGIGALAYVVNYSYSDKYQPSEFTDYNVEGLISELKANHGISDDYSEKDVLTIDYVYTMGGNYNFQKIDLKTEYGTLSIPRSKIRKIDVMYSDVSDGAEKNFKLIGSKHISSNNNGGWLKTGYMLKPGEKFSISATGQITFASLSNQTYKPNGAIASSSTTPATDVYNDEYSYGTEAYPTYGNVVYKIGEQGQVLKAGEKYTGAAKNSGMLYISIYETVYNPSNTGFYNVKVSKK
jgi:hypothetical protein